MAKIRAVAGACVGIVVAAGFMASRAQDFRQAGQQDTDRLGVGDPNCTFFGPDRDKYVNPGSTATQAAMLTSMVTSHFPAMTLAAAAPVIPSAPGGSRTSTVLDPPENTIDKYIFPALTAAGVAPAPPTTDYEFVRRVYLDLTGRIPTPDQVTSFVNDTTVNKRAVLVNALIGSAAWADKWTIWFGDLYQNNSSNTQIVRLFRA